MNRLLIERAIATSLPNTWVSQMGSAKLERPRSRPKQLEGEGREAAVMLLLYPNCENELITVLTSRKDTLQHHPGQVSLPGGRREKNESLSETALRELEEEIGIDRSKVEVLGSLNSIYIPPSDFTVSAFVGWFEGVPKLSIQADEVDQAIEVPLVKLLDPSIRKYSSVATDRVDREVPWFAIGSEQVWGATAMIIDDFIERLKRSLQ